jgi:pimeloyl-ACP methyl ester carboxylesterase
MRAETLHGLVTELGLEPCVIAGGSGGARDSIVTVMLYPELASKLILWMIVGGVYGTVALSQSVLPSMHTLFSQGIEGLLAIDPWKELVTTNPRNRERMLALGPDEIETVMLRWLNAFIPKPGQTIPGIDDADFERIRVPTLIIRGGSNDPYHPKRTSLEVNCLIRNSNLVEPPWREDAWEYETKLRAQGKASVFDHWLEAAPLILAFARD